MQESCDFIKADRLFLEWSELEFCKINENLLFDGIKIIDDKSLEYICEFAVILYHRSVSRKIKIDYR